MSDVSVRIAWGDDAAAVAHVQAAAWREQYAGLVAPGGLPVGADLEPAWRAALSTTSDARNRVLVALDRATVVGFVLTTPASDPDCDPVADGEVAELTVDPGQRGRGHGSRLLQAAVDTLVADRFSRAVTWCIATDDDRRGFLTAAGWAPDSAFRELGLDEEGSTQVTQVRLHTALTD